jgi:MFS superfamily sulfate permease-like transporter
MSNSTKPSLFQYFNESRKWIYIGLILVMLFFIYRFFYNSESNASVEYNSQLIQQQIVNVGKLVVTEGHFAEVLTYKNQDTYLGGLIAIDKKALVVVNADVTVAYDLHKLKYELDEKNKVVNLISIPKEEIKINPDIQFYNIEQSRMSPFTGEDYNKINKTVKTALAKKIDASTLKSNAKNRLLTELSKLLLVTNSMNWTLQYKGERIENEAFLEEKL